MHPLSIKAVLTRATTKNIKKKAVFTTKKNKKIKKRQHGTRCLRQPAAKSPHTKAQRRRVCVNTNVPRNNQKVENK